MTTTITLKHLTLGVGAPKICVPLTGSSHEQLMECCGEIRQMPAELVEWRADFYGEVADQDRVLETLADIRYELPHVPLVFTLRSVEEGGHFSQGPTAYQSLNRAVMASGLAEAVDVELLMDETLVKELVATAREKGVVMILSSHDFHKTPSVEEMVERLVRASLLGAHIPKLAVMPRSARDVIHLLEATRQVREEHRIGPLITMAMGALGVISRVSGEFFGSAVTFGAAGKASAPGQIPAGDLHQVIQLLHRQ